MNSGVIRQKFLDFFKNKGHQIVPSAPLVLKNDPSLLFTNSGMVQFKDYFLGNSTPRSKRIVDTQKCLRVSGKHNDLEDVGLDTYHHTMFEMLGNWSFGDYFKKEAIAWAWELLTGEYGLPKDRLYATVFGGDKKDNLPIDQEAIDFWKPIVGEDRIIHGSKKDNFWEMGESGPCGPCSEIHIDLRSGAEIKKKPGKELVNMDHPQVVEIWNLVFIQFNRLASGKLENLPEKHVDTGMGFERLCMAIQGKTSNYDTDVFTPLIEFISEAAGATYGKDEKKDIAIRVMADHVRAVAFAIADGQLPSNTGAGYVIRRILRRAVRYGFSYLDFKDPFLFRLVPILADQMEDVFPELRQQMDYVIKIIHEEEITFLKTLEIGIEILTEELDYLERVGSRVKSFKAKFSSEPDIDSLGDLKGMKGNVAVSKLAIFSNIETLKEVYNKQTELNLEQIYKFIDGALTFEEAYQRLLSGLKVLPGYVAFTLYDTYGFPLDLTSLIAKENNFSVDEEGFNILMGFQKSRSKADAEKETGDWITIHPGDKPEFIGYEHLTAESSLLKYRKIKLKNKELYQLVFDKTPFYAESGGQVGDTGTIAFGSKKIKVIDTKKENELIVHLVEELPSQLETKFLLTVDARKRQLTMDNHSATHLLHAALRQVLGKHVEQRGSLLNDKILRFDFSHFSAMTDEEISKVEGIVNEKIRENIELNEQRNVPIEKAKEMGAMALFGEKYGDFVRVITFDPTYSVELCGGTHVPATGRIGLFKIISESSVAAGVRRIEAVTAEGAEQYVNQELQLLKEVKALLKNPKDLTMVAKNLLEEKHQLEKRLEEVHQQQANQLKDALAGKGSKVNGYYFIAEKVNLPNADALKNISYALRNQFEDLFLVLAADIENKPQVAVMIGEKALGTKKLHAGNIVKELAKEIDGGGGGQPFFATAGGKNIHGLDAVVEKAREICSR